MLCDLIEENASNLGRLAYTDLKTDLAKDGLAKIAVLCRAVGD